MRIGLLVLVACHAAPSPSPIAAPPFPPAGPRKPATAIDYVHHLERLALDGGSSELPTGLGYEIRTAHDCKPTLEEIPAVRVSPRLPPTSTVVVARCRVPGISHPSPGVGCVAPGRKTVYTVVVDRDASGFYVVGRRTPATSPP